MNYLTAFAIVYGICLIPTIIMICLWPKEEREMLEEKLGSFLFFLSAWIISPAAFLWMLCKPFMRK